MRHQKKCIKLKGTCDIPVNIIITPFLRKRCNDMDWTSSLGLGFRFKGAHYLTPVWFPLWHSFGSSPTNHPYLIPHLHFIFLLQNFCYEFNLKDLYCHLVYNFHKLNVADYIFRCKFVLKIFPNTFKFVSIYIYVVDFILY